jgi:hypothetical protein
MTQPTLHNSPKKLRPVANFLGRFLLIVVGLLFPLLALEAGVRLVNLAPPPEPNPAIWEPHPLFGWWHIPYSGGLFHSDYNEFESEVRINPRGLRDRDIGYDNPAGALRVLSLADSFGEALQINLVDTYHKQLETLLAESTGRPVEVLNAGVGGWGTDQEAIFYVAEGFRYNPDIVLVAFFIRNDAVNNYGPLEIARNGGRQQKQFFTLSPAGELIAPPVQEKITGQIDPQAKPALESPPPLLTLADTLWRWSALYRTVMPYARDIPPVLQALGPAGLLGGEAVIRATNPVTPIPFFVYQEPPADDFAAAWAVTEAILARLNTEVESRGAKLAVVLVAAPEQVVPEQWQKTVARYPAMKNRAWDLNAPNRRLNNFLAAQGIAHLDLLPVFRAAAGAPDAPPLHFRHDQHWTAAGHRLAAETIHQFLLAQFPAETAPAH